MSQYLIAANMMVLIVPGIRQQYLGYRLRTYMKEKYPEKLKGFRSTFRMDRWLHKEDDTGDPKLVRLKAKAKHATDITALAFLLSPLLWILYFIMVVLTSR